MCVCLCLFVSVFACLLVCLFVCLFLCLCVWFGVRLSVHVDSEPETQLLLSVLGQARWQITANVPAAYTVLSNMDLSAISPSPSSLAGMRRWVFNQSPPLSTYLVVLVVCEFDRVSVVSANGVTVSVWAPADEIAAGQVGIDERRSHDYSAFFR